MKYIIQISKVALATFSVFYIGVMLYTIAMRISYPFAVDWMEGSSYVIVSRILSGQLIYVKPTIEFVPYIYAPLYYYACAVIAKIFGLSFLSMRIVSTISSIGIFITLFFWLRKSGASWVSIILSMGLFALSYSFIMAIFDIARVDAFANSLFFLGAYLTTLSKKRYYFLAGMLFAMSAISKQVFLPLFIGWSVFAIYYYRGKSYLILLYGLLLFGLSALIFSLINGQWYWYFVFDLPSHHLLDKKNLIRWTPTVLKSLPVSFAIGVTYLLLYFKLKDREMLFFIILVSLMGGLSLVAIANLGAAHNVLITGYLALSMLTGLGLDKIIKTQPGWLSVFFILALILQFDMRPYTVAKRLPVDGEQTATVELVKFIKNKSGEVWVPFHNELAIMADKKPFANWIAICELQRCFGGSQDSVSKEFFEQLDQKYLDRLFSYVVVDKPWSLPDDFTKYYGPTYNYWDNYPLTIQRVIKPNIWTPISTQK